MDLLHAQLSALHLDLFEMTCIAAQVRQRSGSTITHEAAMPDMLSGTQYRASRPSKHPPCVDAVAALEKTTLTAQMPDPAGITHAGFTTDCDNGSNRGRTVWLADVCQDRTSISKSHSSIEPA
jgi:hypothetical protein